MKLQYQKTTRDKKKAMILSWLVLWKIDWSHEGELCPGFTDSSSSYSSNSYVAAILDKLTFIGIDQNFIDLVQVP